MWGYMPGKFSLYQDLSVEENLQFLQQYFTTVENYDLVKDIYVQLEPFKRRRAGKLSGGMKQKPVVCINPSTESVVSGWTMTTGVDAVSRKLNFQGCYSPFKEQGITILVSTPHGWGHALWANRTFAEG